MRTQQGFRWQKLCWFLHHLEYSPPKKQVVPFTTPKKNHSIYSTAGQKGLWLQAFGPSCAAVLVEHWVQLHVHLLCFLFYSLWNDHETSDTKVVEEQHWSTTRGWKMLCQSYVWPILIYVSCLSRSSCWLMNIFGLTHIRTGLYDELSISNCVLPKDLSFCWR